MKMIVGLGNPGAEYNKTRHNMGFMILDNFLKDEEWSKNNYGFFVKTKINKEDVLFLKPTTFMNLSGEVVQYFCNFYKIELKDLLVIQDDMDLPFCSIRLKINSGDGGHNGIKNIILCMKSNNFLRLKFGITRPNDNNVIDYVLHKFSKEELEQISSKLDICNNIINDFIQNKDINELMNKYN